MKKNKIYLWALGLMLGGCKSTEATTKCDYSQAPALGTVDCCSTPVCELITGAEFIYEGKTQWHSFLMINQSERKQTSLTVCDSTKLKNVPLKIGSTYILDYNRKLGCKTPPTTSLFLTEYQEVDILSIKEKAN